MKVENTKFKDPIFVTRPLFPPKEEVFIKMSEIWESKWLSNGGSQHQQLEKEISQYLKVPHVSLFNNGTIGLMVACKALDLKGEVITTPFTFPATPHSLSWNGIKPIFCDIDPISLNIDAQKIEEKISGKTSGILGVHVFGNPCDVKSIDEISRRKNLRTIYDAAHGFGLEVDGKGIGTFGDISMFSFHPTKLFHTGEGGALTTGDLELKKKIDLLKNFGIKNEEEVTGIGINGKMNEIQAALGLVVLSHIAKEKQERRRIANLYKTFLSGAEGIEIIDKTFQTETSDQYFVIRIKKEFGVTRDSVHVKLKEYNVFTRKYFFPLCSDYPHYRDSAQNFPVANQVISEVLSLPFYGDLSNSDVEKICQMILSLRGK